MITKRQEYTVLLLLAIVALAYTGSVWVHGSYTASILSVNCRQ